MVRLITVSKDSNGRKTSKPVERHPALSIPCRHRGEETRRVDCQSCGGNVELRVYECPLHGECTIGKKIDNLACCLTCGDYDPVAMTADGRFPSAWKNRPRFAKPAGLLKVGVMQQRVGVGGAEIWAETMCRYSRHDWSFWSDRLQVEDNAEEELGQAVIHSALTTKWAEWRDAQDVIIVWCHMAEMVMPRLVEFRGEIILLSQGSGQWTADFMHSMQPFVDRMFAVSEYSVRTFPPAVRDQVHVVMNSADPARVKPSMTRKEARGALGIVERLAVTYCGRWSIEKNPISVAEGVAALHGSLAVYKCPDTANWRAGQREVLQLLGAAQVRFVGDRLSVADTLAASDVLVLASPGEGCALIVMEALAAGVPVVSTAVGAIEEMEREHGQLVVRVPVDPSPEQLATAILEAHHFREKLIAAGLEFTEKWNVTTMAAKWDGLLEQGGSRFAAASDSERLQINQEQ